MHLNSASSFSSKVSCEYLTAISCEILPAVSLRPSLRRQLLLNDVRPPRLTCVAVYCLSGGEVLVSRPHLLGEGAQGILLLNLREDEGLEEVLEDKDEEEEENGVDEKVKEVRKNAQLMHATW